MSDKEIVLTPEQLKILEDIMSEKPKLVNYSESTILLDRQNLSDFNWFFDNWLSIWYV